MNGVSTICERVGSRRASSRANAFTLVELVVVVAIVLILLAIALPAASTLWAERKVADSETILLGALNNARAKAMSAGGVETGLFFFVDRQGVQHIVPVVQADLDPALPPSEQLHLLNVFWFDGRRDDILPVPMRVMPRYAIETSDPRGDAYLFSATELANSVDEAEIQTGTDVAQRHRNVFTIVFGKDGRIKPWRDVLIEDPSPPNNLANDGLGDRTGMYVGDSEVDPRCAAKKYYKINGDIVFIDPTGSEHFVQYLIASETGDDVAINFPSVDGLLLYDDQVFRDNGGVERPFIERTAQPFYISRLTGEVLRGPVGEKPL